MIKESVLLEDIPRTNMYGANKRATKHKIKGGKFNNSETSISHFQ